MQQTTGIIQENTPIAREVYRLVLRGDWSAVTRPGQFVDIQLPGRFLRRPISVCDWAGDALTLIYKTVGEGTAQLAAMGPGETLDLLTGLGNGYDAARAGTAPLLIGGGAGVPPLYGLCRRLREAGRPVTVLLGFNSRADVFYEEELRALGARVLVATADGSYGRRGFVTDLLPGLSYSFFYACGPMPMLRALHTRVSTPGQYSFEERMGCGFGACMGCSCQTQTGAKRICRDGPVMESEEVLWED